MGVEQASGRRRCFPLWVFAGLVLATVSEAQERVVQTHRASEPEGRLLAYYSAAMTFSPLGQALTDGRWSLALEATWLPRLDDAQRRPGIDKPESTNLSPILPRPRAAWRTAGGTSVEVSWIPPLTVGDARANVVSAAASRTLGRWGGVTLAPRLSAVVGRVRGAITCNRRTLTGRGPDLAVYYANICHGNDSDDWFEPRLVAGEVLATRSLPALHARAWAALGGRVDRTRFDIGVRKADGSRDADHPVLQLSDTRLHLAVGGRWRLPGPLEVSAEWFYAPGSVSTLRTLLAWTGGR